MNSMNNVQDIKDNCTLDMFFFLIILVMMIQVNVMLGYVDVKLLLFINIITEYKKM